MMKHLRYSHVLILLLALTACKQSNPDSDEEASYKAFLISQQVRVALPVSSFIKKGPCGANSPILAVIKDGTYQIEDHPVQDATDLDLPIKKEIKQLPSKISPYFLIAAPPKTKFKNIRTSIRAAAKAGISDIYFAIKKNASDLNLIQSKLHLPLPTCSGCGPELSPMFVKVDQYGAIYINTGPEQEILDLDVNLRQLPKLNKRLKTYTAAARAGGHEPVVQIWADSQTSYQRIIDLLTELRRVNIRTVFFVDLVESPFDYLGGCKLPRSNKQHPPRLPIAPKFKPPIE